MQTRFTFGGDEHILCECSEEMSFEAFFKSLSATSILVKQNIKGVTEVCGGNAAYMVRFDPDLIAPEHLMERLREVDSRADHADPYLETRIIEIPVYYGDPWTAKVMNDFRDRHQAPNLTDLEYAASINGKKTVEEFITSHHESPWFVSQVGFVCGVPWLYQMVERERQIEVPKYVRPRTDTPRHTIGHGGCFAAIYAVRGAGGYQMFGITPMPIFDPRSEPKYFDDSIVFSRPGDIVKFKAISGDEYEQLSNEVKDGLFTPKIKSVNFNLKDFLLDIDGYNKNLIGILYEH